MLDYIFLVGAQQGEETDWTQMILMWALIIGVFYFFMIRPQQKRTKEEKKFRESLDKNSKVVTIGGLHGIVLEMDDTTVTLKLEGGQKVKVEKSAISPKSSADLAEKKA